MATARKVPRKTLEEIADSRPKSISTKLQEEINLLYVAITRTKHKLYIPDTLLPPVYPNASNIQVLKTREEEEDLDSLTLDINDSAFTITARSLDERYPEIRKTHSAAYEPWTRELDLELTEMYIDGLSIKDLAQYFGRTKGAIRSRLDKLNVEG